MRSRSSTPVSNQAEGDEWIINMEDSSSDIKKDTDEGSVQPPATPRRVNDLTNHNKDRNGLSESSGGFHASLKEETEVEPIQYPTVSIHSNAAPARLGLDTPSTFTKTQEQTTHTTSGYKQLPAKTLYDTMNHGLDTTNENSPAPDSSLQERYILGRYRIHKAMEATPGIEEMLSIWFSSCQALRPLDKLPHTFYESFLDVFSFFGRMAMPSELISQVKASEHMFEAIMAVLKCLIEDAYEAFMPKFSSDTQHVAICANLCAMTITTTLDRIQAAILAFCTTGAYNMALEWKEELQEYQGTHLQRVLDILRSQLEDKPKDSERWLCLALLSDDDLEALLGYALGRVSSYGLLRKILDLHFGTRMNQSADPLVSNLTMVLIPKCGRDETIPQDHFDRKHEQYIT